MILYSQTDLETVPFPIKQFTVSVGMDGFSIMNYSNIPLSLSSATVGSLGDVPPLFSRSILASAGDVISVSEASFTTSAIAQPSQFVELTQSTGTVPALVPLAVVPGYQLTVTGNVTANLPGGTTVNIGNTPAVTINSGTVNIGTMPSVTIASGTVTATINNASINTQSTVVNETISTFPWLSLAIETTTITSLANGSQIYANIPNFTMGYYDAVVIEMSSANGILNKYAFEVVQQRDNGEGSGASYLNIGSYVTPKTGGFFDNVNQSFQSNPISLDPTFATGSLVLSITNTSGSTIASDTITLRAWLKNSSGEIVNPTSSPVPTQAQYATTQYNLGSYTFASTSVPANSQGASQFTGSVNVTNAKRLQFLIQQTASSGFSGTGTSGTSAWGVSFQLQGSEDNSTWYAIAGGPVSPSSVSIVTNGAINVAVDTASMPQMGAGYPYIRWALQLFNGNTTTAETLSESCTLALLVQE